MSKTLTINKTLMDFTNSGLDFEIKLDKNTYNAGETVKGILFIKADKNLKIKNLKFSVCGKETQTLSLLHKVLQSLSLTDPFAIFRAEKYDIFFFEDLSSFLKSINALPHDDDSVVIPQGSTTIPFQFFIPYNAQESYRGNVARIVYEVEICADMGWKADHHSMSSFDVLNPNMEYTSGVVVESWEQDKREGKPYLGLELEVTNSNNGIPIFPPGGIIKGKLKVENCGMKKVKKAIIQLLGIERSTGDIGMESIKKKIKYDEDGKDNTIAFEIQIPQNAKRSYNAKYSEYYWILETKIDISGGYDIHANRIIQVI